MTIDVYNNGLFSSVVGRLDPKTGDVYDADLLSHRIGKVEADGNVYDASLFSNRVGRVDVTAGNILMRGGAALLLLLNKKVEEDNSSNQISCVIL